METSIDSAQIPSRKTDPYQCLASHLMAPLVGFLYSIIFSITHNHHLMCAFQCLLANNPCHTHLFHNLKSRQENASVIKPRLWYRCAQYKAVSEHTCITVTQTHGALAFTLERANTLSAYHSEERDACGFLMHTKSTELRKWTVWPWNTSAHLSLGSVLWWKFWWLGILFKMSCQGGK